MLVKRIISVILNRLLKTSLYKLHYLTVRIDPVVVKQNVERISIKPRELNYDDFLFGDRKYINEGKLACYKSRFNDDTYKAYGVFIDGKLVYSSWISYKKIGMPVETQPVLLSQEEAYLEDDYCMPEYRGRGIHTQVLWYRLNEIVKNGRKNAFITIFEDNQAALIPAIKCGFRDKGVFTVGTILGIKINTFKK